VDSEPYLIITNAPQAAPFAREARSDACQDLQERASRDRFAQSAVVGEAFSASGVSLMIRKPQTLGDFDVLLWIQPTWRFDGQSPGANPGLRAGRSGKGRSSGLRWARGAVIGARKAAHELFVHLLLVAVAGAGPAFADSVQAADGSPVTADSLFAEVAAMAAERAAAAYEPPADTLPEAFRQMSYDQYRAIRFRPEAALWRDQSRFEAQFFHPGFLFRHPVTLYEVDAGEIREIGFDPGLFRYEAEATELVREGRSDLGFAGFRMHYPLNTEEYKDELVVFLGASYFRLVGPGQVYGLSSRGLAIDTAPPGGEEFPAFRKFWLLRPAPDADNLTILALLDGPSVSGAYRFDVHAGFEVAVTVDKRLYARRDVARLGISPLTSMFLFGEAGVRRYDDFRPRAHDSEGLMKQTAAGEWIWRPLTNPVRLRVGSLRDERPRGFGLVQRNREFSGYLDMEAEYHRRPSQWVTPVDGDWGIGGVELVEIPTEDETNDNIVVYWVGDAPFRAGDQRRYRYRLTLFDDVPPGNPPARVVRTRSGWGAVPGAVEPPPRSLRRYIVDFAGGELDTLAPGASIQPSLEASSGTATDLHLRRLPDAEGWRATFLLDPEDGRAVDMRLVLTLDGRPVTETWNHVWYPDEL
jgi:periplasmic glucans biosynthesis protein